MERIVTHIADEIIFKAKNTRNRLIIELMIRGGMRISEVLNLTTSDVEDRKLIILNTKTERLSSTFLFCKRLPIG